MSFIKRITTFIGITPEEDEEENEVQEEKKGAPVTEIHSRAGRRAELSAVPRDPTTSGGAGSAPVDNVVAAYRMNVIIIEPRTFDDAQQVAINLQKKKPVLLNFEHTDRSVTSRIIDFISGTTYALNGDIKKISNNVVLCAPSNVNVSYAEDEQRLPDGMPWLNK